MPEPSKSRDLAWFLDRTPPLDPNKPRVLNPDEWGRRSVEAFIARHSPKETAVESTAERADTWTVTVTIPMALPSAMKDSLAAAVAAAVSKWEPDERDGWDAVVTGQPTRQGSADVEISRLRALLGHLEETSRKSLNSVSAMVREQTQRAEQAEDRFRKAEQAYGRLAARADDAEAARDRWRTRAEQAEAAVQRARDLHRPHDCAQHAHRRHVPTPCVNVGYCSCGEVYPCRTITVLDAKVTH